MERLKRKIVDIATGKKHHQISVGSKSAYAIASACAALAPTRSTLKSSRQFNARIIQNFLVVWLDSTIDEFHNNDCLNIITKLQQVVNSVYTFTEVDECLNFLGNIKEEEIFMIVSGAYSQTVVPIVHNIPQVSSIYIFCENNIEHEHWAHKWVKVKGVFMDILPIYEAIKQAAQECDQNTIGMSFIQTNDGTSDQNLDELDQSFIYNQILKEIVLTVDFEQQYIKDFITYCRKQFIGNVAELQNIDKIEREYHHHVPIWWYTYQCFLCSMLNRALRTMEMDIIIKMGFFVRDLHEHITQLHSKQYTGQHQSASFTVYRAQGISQSDFYQLKKTQGGLVSFNNFLSTSKNHQVSLDVARRTTATSDLVGILFVMTIDPSIPSIPFANIRDVSCHETEEEILFSMHSIFRIGQIKEIDNNMNRLWQVELILTSNNDPQLQALTERIQKETVSHKKGWYKLSEVLIKLGHYNKAQQICDTLITQTLDDEEKGYLYCQLGLIKFYQGEYRAANSFYHTSLEIRQKTLPPEHADVAACYNDIGLVYEKTSEYSKALSYLDKAFAIYEKTLPANHPSLAMSNYNIGRVYCRIGEYVNALSSYEKALEIYDKTLPPNYSDVAASYNSIGTVYEKMGEYSKALSSLEKSLEILRKTLPPNHPDMAHSYSNIASVYEKMCEYSTALTYYEKALEICEKTLPVNQSELAMSHNSIGLIYFQMGDYSNALSSHEKAHEIYNTTLSSNHPHLAASYVCIGAVYDKTREYSKAFLYYEKALEIYQNTLPPNHPDLATSYNNIGSVHEKMGNYSTALLYHRKALEIYENIFPSNHPNVANSYTWLGYLYDKMGDHVNALSFYECALDIGQHSLPANHPCLQLWQDNLIMIKRKL